MPPPWQCRKGEGGARRCGARVRLGIWSRGRSVYRLSTVHGDARTKYFARESLCKRFANESAFVRHTGMASRFVGAPDLTGHGPRRVRMRMATARTKASKFLFETISSGTGRDEVGALHGIREN